MSQHRQAGYDGIERRSSPPLVQHEWLLAQALKSVADAMFITDRSGTISWVNDAFCNLTGYAAEELIGRTPAILKSGRQSQAFYSALWETILMGKVWHAEVVEQRKDGSFIVVDETIAPVYDAFGVLSHFITNLHDITQHKRDSERDHHVASHDMLTGLYNRAGFLELHRRAIDSASAERQGLATLFIDLDCFKPINDALGHHIGDKVLSAVAERMQAAVRRSDVVARFGGDEFVVLLPDCADRLVATHLARKLLLTLSRPFMLSGRASTLSASIGIALYPYDGVDTETLLIKADEAMYIAKCRGGNAFQFWGGASTDPASHSYRVTACKR